MEAFSQFGKYQILDRIAYGGMAELFRARIQGDQGFQKLVAVKKMHAHFSIDPAVVEAFIEEAKLAAFLQHPNIVQIYDFGCVGDAYFIVMEYLQGKDLRTVTTALETHGRRLGMETSLAVAAAVCSGLEYAHRLTDMMGRPLQIVHRDISPQNIFVTYAGQVKILDFGIAKVTDRGATTEAGVLKGKVAYMSPEQACGRKIDHRSDQFAVGVILYELLTGRRLYQGNTMEILRRAQTGDFVPPQDIMPDLAPDLQYLFDHLLAVTPEARFPDCGAALAAIEECLGDLTARAIERHLADLVSDLFAAEKHAEAAALQALAGDDDGAQGHDTAETSAVAAPRPPVRRLPRKWLLWGGLGLLSALALFVWIRWHIPGGGAAKPLEAFEARRYGEIGADAAGGQPSDGSPTGPPAPAPSPLEQQARALMETDPVQAKALWQQVVERTPDNVRAHFNLGLIYLELRAYPEAVAAFERVLAQAPDMMDARFNLGFAYAKMNRYTEAAALYRQVADQVPEYLDEVLFNLAIVQDFQGDRKGAARSLEAAIRFNPHNVRAISYLARMEGRFSTPP
jgi:tetratricopeptide (TPR) repeat protein/tRNA A-37 threonylcarbamoyl transferase component Bud32